MTRQWWQSWDLWLHVGANVLALIVMVSNAFGFSDFQAHPLVPALAAVIIIVINMYLRRRAQAVTVAQWSQSVTMLANFLALIVMVVNAFGFDTFQPDAWVTQIATVIIILVNIGLQIWHSRAPAGRVFGLAW